MQLGWGPEGVGIEYKLNTFNTFVLNTNTKYSTKGQYNRNMKEEQ